jgi:hypothetical protein
MHSGGFRKNAAAAAAGGKEMAERQQALKDFERSFDFVLKGS